MLNAEEIFQSLMSYNINYNQSGKLFPHPPNYAHSNQGNTFTYYIPHHVYDNVIAFQSLFVHIL